MSKAKALSNHGCFKFNLLLTGKKLMSQRIYNFNAGPAAIPEPVLLQVKEELLNYQGTGLSIIEESHRSPHFLDILKSLKTRVRRLMDLPQHFEVLLMHGGAAMQWSALPLNFLEQGKQALYYDSGLFANKAIQTAKTYGQVNVIASSQSSGYDHIPVFEKTMLKQDAAYFHITSNNTAYGTAWQQLPDTENIPLVIDATSDIFSKKIDFSKAALVYASFQKNLGPSGLALVIIRKDLLQDSAQLTPPLLNYQHVAQTNSLPNTTNTFAIYVADLILEWLETQGGISAIETLNHQKAKLLYDVLDNSNLYQPFAQKQDRSVMNVCFHLPNQDLLAKFLKEAEDNRLHGLQGHRSAGGARASIYNATSLEAVQALAKLMIEFEKIQNL